MPPAETRAAWTGQIARASSRLLGLMLVIALFTLLSGDATRLRDALLSGDVGGALRADPVRYLSRENIKTIAVQSTIIGTCGIGMTLVVIGGGIDLSIGSAAALGTVTVALVFGGEFWSRVVDTIFRGQPAIAWLVAAMLVLSAVALSAIGKWSPRAVGIFLVLSAGGIWLFNQAGAVPAVIAGIAIGTLCGLLNGLAITTTRVVPFIITLGSMEIFRGAAQFVARGESVGIDSRLLRDNYPWLRNLMAASPKPAWLIVSPGVWLMLIAGAVTALLLRRTRWGRYIFAVGSNEAAARLSGVPVPKVKLLMYGMAGLMTGLAAVMQFSRLAYGSSTAGTGLELDVIAAVVIGGGSLRGGEGSIGGTFLGAAIMGFMRNGCDLAGIPNAVQRILIGAVIVLAVSMDELRHRRLR